MRGRRSGDVVHRGPDGKLIVVAALVTVGDANPAYDQLLQLLPGKCQSKKTTPETQVAIRALLSAPRLGRKVTSR